MKGNRVFITISPVLNERLEVRAKENGCSTSQIISIALSEYLGPSSITKEDLEGLRETLMNTKEFMRNYPLTLKECFPEPPTPYIQDGVIVTKEIQQALNEVVQKGLIIPDMIKVKERPLPDPDIKHSFSLSHNIRPGDGVVGRLRAAGIDPLEITKARRNMQRGRDYDKTLEQYFNLL